MYKTLLWICLLVLPLFLGGCFLKKNKDITSSPPTIVNQDIDIEVPLDNNEPNTGNNGQDTNVDMLHDDEFDENGEFDPTKFQDDDIDDVMDLLKELVVK